MSGLRFEKNLRLLRLAKVVRPLFLTVVVLPPLHKLVVWGVGPRKLEGSLCVKQLLMTTEESGGFLVCVVVWWVTVVVARPVFQVLQFIPAGEWLSDLFAVPRHRVPVLLRASRLVVLSLVVPNRSKGTVSQDFLPVCPKLVPLV